MKIQTVRKVKKYVKRILLVLSVLMIIVEGLLLVMDEKVLWNVLPGVTSTNDTQSFCTGWVEAAEAFPLDNLDNATEHQKMGAGLIMMAVTGKNIESAMEGTEADAILLQYTQASIKCRFLNQQGKLNSIQYHLIKTPYKAGNTWLMKKVLPHVQSVAQLPEDFLSKEYIEDFEEGGTDER